jgi:hypothetical protein
MKKILFISGSVGLGHVSRDLAIVRELWALEPEIEFSWLASGAAKDVIMNAGEKLLPEAAEWADENDPVEAAAKKGFHVNLISYLLKSKKDWSHNVDVFKKVTASLSFDLVVGDETYEVIFDFIGLDSMSANPMEKMGVYAWNKIWSKGYKNPGGYVDATLFVGEPEDIPDRKLGPFLPNRRDWARYRGLKYLGYVFPFDPAAYADKAKVRAAVGFGPGPLVVCAIGGTSIGKELLELCGQAYPIAGKAVPGLRMVLVCGPQSHVLGDDTGIPGRSHRGEHREGGGLAGDPCERCPERGQDPLRTAWGPALNGRLQLFIVSRRFHSPGRVATAVDVLSVWFPPPIRALSRLSRETRSDPWLWPVS